MMRPAQILLLLYGKLHFSNTPYNIRTQLVRRLIDRKDGLNRIEILETTFSKTIIAKILKIFFN